MAQTDVTPKTKVELTVILTVVCLGAGGLFAGGVGYGVVNTKLDQVLVAVKDGVNKNETQDAQLREDCS